MVELFIDNLKILVVFLYKLCCWFLGDDSDLIGIVEKLLWFFDCLK